MYNCLIRNFSGGIWALWTSRLGKGSLIWIIYKTPTAFRSASILTTCSGMGGGVGRWSPVASNPFSSDTLVPSADSKLFQHIKGEIRIRIKDNRIKLNLLKGVAAIGVHFAVEWHIFDGFLIPLRCGEGHGQKSDCQDLIEHQVQI